MHTGQSFANTVCLKLQMDYAGWVACFLIHYKDLVCKSQLLWKFPGFQSRFSTSCFLLSPGSLVRETHLRVVPLWWKYKNVTSLLVTFLTDTEILKMSLPSHCPVRHRGTNLCDFLRWSILVNKHTNRGWFGLRKQHIISTSTPNWLFFNKVSPHVRK